LKIADSYLETIMKIRLVDYKEFTPAEVEENYDPKQLDIEFVDLQYAKPLHLEGTVEKGLDTVAFRGHIVSEIEHTCGRCLNKIKSSFDKPFELFYETKGKESVETIDDIRELLILEHPLAYVCSEKCKGLCPHCGINRNESQCRCESEISSNPFSQLKNILNRRKEE
jgi:uncharacterized protein